jgi:hypothetical protein
MQTNDAIRPVSVRPVEEIPTLASFFSDLLDPFGGEFEGTSKSDRMTRVVWQHHHDNISQLSDRERTDETFCSSIWVIVRATVPVGWFPPKRGYRTPLACEYFRPAPAELYLTAFDAVRTTAEPSQHVYECKI